VRKLIQRIEPPGVVDERLQQPDHVQEISPARLSDPLRQRLGRHVALRKVRLELGCVLGVVDLFEHELPHVPQARLGSLLAEHEWCHGPCLERVENGGVDPGSQQPADPARKFASVGQQADDGLAPEMLSGLVQPVEHDHEPCIACIAPIAAQHLERLDDGVNEGNHCRRRVDDEVLDFDTDDLAVACLDVLHGLDFDVGVLEQGLGKSIIPAQLARKRADEQCGIDRGSISRDAEMMRRHVGMRLQEARGNR